VLPLLLPDESLGRRRMVVKVAPGGKGKGPVPPEKPVIDPISLKLAKDLALATQKLPPAVLTMERKPDELTLVLRQPNLRTASAKIIELVLESSLERVFTPGAGNALGGVGAKIEAVPPPPPPKKQ